MPLESTETLTKVTSEHGANAGGFACAVFEALQNESVKYVILRNYKGLPENEGHDIDILVDKRCMAIFESLLLTSAHSHGWRLVRNPKRYGFRSYVFTPREGKGSPRALKWDIWEAISWKGIPWVDSVAVLGGARIYNAFCVPSPGAEAAVLLLKEVLPYGTISKKYLDRIWKFCEEDAEGFEMALRRHFGRWSVHELLDNVHHRRWEHIEKAAWKLRLLLMQRAFWSRPFSTLHNWLLFIVLHIRCYLRAQTGFFLCFIGPDGSGKSTISCKVSESLAQTFEHSRYYHGHFGVLPELKTYVRWWRWPWKNESESPASLAKNNPPGPLRGAGYLVYYGLDYLLGHLFITWARGKGDLVVFDRYFYDYVLQPGPISMDNPLFRIFLSLIPTPEAVIYLQAPPEAVRARKPELSLEEIARQARACEKIAGRLPQAYVVENTKPIHQVVVEVCQIVIEQMAESATSGVGSG